MRRISRRALMVGTVGTVGAGALGLGGAVASARPRAAVTIDVDFSQTPDLEQWALDGRDLMLQMYPTIVDLLTSPGWAPPEYFKLFMDPVYDGVAYASGDTITVGAKYVREHPDDVGLLVHEETHILQQYKEGAPGWFTEGAADWVRHYHYQHDDIKPIPGQTYLDGYVTAAYFLHWIETTYDAAIVNKVNAPCREGTYTDEIWPQLTGKTPDQLWDEMPKPSGAQRNPKTGLDSYESEAPPRTR